MRPPRLLVSPVLLAFLQQEELGECPVRPLVIGPFVVEHSHAFVRVWGTDDQGQ